MEAVRAPALMVALLVAGCTAAQPERNERTAAEDQITTEGTAAPERNEHGAIGVAEFLAGQRSGLARYQNVREDLVRLTGRLRDISSLVADPDKVWIAVDSVDGLEENELVPAEMKNPAPEIDAALEQIGRNGQITLEGRARNTPGRVGTLHTRSDGSTTTSFRARSWARSAAASADGGQPVVGGERRGQR